MSMPAAAVMTNCAAKPSACGYPDASNTGVKAGISLKKVPQQVRRGTGWYWDSRGWVVINGNGAVFSGYLVDAEINVQANNVTIRNSRITPNGMFGIAIRRAKNTIIEYNEIGPAIGEERLMVGIKDIYGDATGTLVRRNDIKNVGTGVQIYRGTIRGNYIHDMGYLPGDHTNGVTSNGSTSLLVIRNNTIFNRFDQADAIGLFQDFGLEANRIIDNNLLAGGGYTLYAGQNVGKAQTYNIVVTNNRFSRRFYPRSGYWGAVTAFSKSGSGNVWSNNFWDHNGAKIYP